MGGEPWCVCRDRGTRVSRVDRRRGCACLGIQVAAVLGVWQQSARRGVCQRARVALPLTVSLCVLALGSVFGAAVARFYGMFIHVSIMIFIGFGYLMTFLKRFGYSALGINMLLAVVAWLWNVLVSLYDVVTSAVARLATALPRGCRVLRCPWC